MRLTVALLLFAISFNSMAQIDNQKMQYLKKVEKFRKMRNIGFAMIVVGAGMGITGISRLTKATYYTNSSGQTTSSDPGAAFLWIGGAPLFGGGMPLTLIGHKKMKQYERKLVGTGATVNFQISPYQQGLVFTYKF